MFLECNKKKQMVHWFCRRAISLETTDPAAIYALAWRPRVHSGAAFGSFDIGPSYHCEAESTKRWIVHPLTANVSRVKPRWDGLVYPTDDVNYEKNPSESMQHVFHSKGRSIHGWNENNQGWMRVREKENYFSWLSFWIFCVSLHVGLMIWTYIISNVRAERVNRRRYSVYNYDRCTSRGE